MTNRLETNRPLAIELTGINKSFGAVHANRDIDLAIPQGTIHGIIGENGAGKSTLMSILYGFYEADSGVMALFGQKTAIKSSNDAIAAGVGMVHQHFMLIDTFTVLENIILGAEDGQRLITSLDHARAELQRLADSYGLKVDPDALVGDLPVGERQRVEILKALYRGAKILILDEPTGVLTPQEADQLFKILRVLRDQGTTILLITHKLREIMEITDAVSVMRAGAMIAHYTTAQVTREELAETMVGRHVQVDLDKDTIPRRECLLIGEKLTLYDRDGIARLDHVNLELYGGEIVAIAGVSGNGQSELLSVLSGMSPLDEGFLHVLGRDITSEMPCDPAEMRDIGLGHIPEDRNAHGLVGTFSAEENAILGFQRHEKFTHRILQKARDITDFCKTAMTYFDVRPLDPTLKSANFSGGNQQKLIIAREMAHSPQVLLVGQPTRGVDIGAIEFIHQQLIRKRDEGHAVLVVSVELDEVMALADRILVMFEGRIVGEVTANETDEKTLGLMMANAMNEEARS